MELHHLRHFIAVAEDLHFGKAALRLRMVQSALSQSIRRLEESVGVQLLERSSRHVLLTEAGQTFLTHAKLSLEHAALAQRLAVQSSKGELQELRIGFVTAALHEALPTIVRRLSERQPDLRIVLEEGSTETQAAALRAGTVDLGFINIIAKELDGLKYDVVERSAFVLAVPSAWPLARQKRVRMKDLASHPFVLFPRDINPQMHADILSACRAAGFIPNVTQEAAHIFSALTLVASGKGIALVRDFWRFLPVDGVTFVPVSDIPTYLQQDTAMAWSPQSSASVLSVIASIRGEIKPASASRRAEPAPGRVQHPAALAAAKLK